MLAKKKSKGTKKEGSGGTKSSRGGGRANGSTEDHHEGGGGGGIRGSSEDESGATHSRSGVMKDVFSKVLNNCSHAGALAYEHRAVWLFAAAAAGILYFGEHASI